MDLDHGNIAILWFALVFALCVVFIFSYNHDLFWALGAWSAYEIIEGLRRA